MADEKKAPIIIKKVKKGGHGGHHGGAWKVAYADFVTAMMAFFLLLWLLSSVPTKKLEGIANYFTPTVGLKDAMGIGFSGGLTSGPPGKDSQDKTSKSIVYGSPSQGAVVKMNQKSSDEIKEQIDAKNFTNVQSDLYKAINSNPELKEFKESILIDQTPEGLRIQIMEKDKKPMFQPGSSELLPNIKKILAVIANLIKYMPNYISISGHTTPDNNFRDTYSDNWVLSADRANSTRRFLLQNGIENEQINRIVGKADQEPLLVDTPKDSANMRISIILLKNSLITYQKKALPDEMNKK